MTVLKKLKKYVGILICIFSGMFAIASAIRLFEDSVPVVLTMYILVGIVPFSIGIYLLKGKGAFDLKKSTLPEYRVFVWVTFAAPALLSGIQHFSWKNNSGDFLYMDNLTQEWVGYLLVITGMMAYFSAGRWFVAGWKNTETHVKWILAVSLTISIATGFITRNDYNAIHKDGLLLSPFGEKEKIHWSEIKYAEIDGYVSGGRDSDFVWRFYFNLKDGRVVNFGPFGYNKYGLEDSLAIKELLKEQQISWTVYNLTEKEWEYVEVDMKYDEEAKPEDFYAVFQYNPSKKEYYSIPFE